MAVREDDRLAALEAELARLRERDEALSSPYRGLRAPQLSEWEQKLADAQERRRRERLQAKHEADLAARERWGRETPLRERRRRDVEALEAQVAAAETDLARQRHELLKLRSTPLKGRAA